MTLPHPSPLAVLLLCSTDDPDRAVAALLAARADVDGLRAGPAGDPDEAIRDRHRQNDAIA